MESKEDKKSVANYGANLVITGILIIFGATLVLAFIVNIILGVIVLGLYMIFWGILLVLTAERIKNMGGF
jgi:uncharacterized membrane protein